MSLSSCYYTNQGAALLGQRASAANFSRSLGRIQRQYGSNSDEYRDFSAFFDRVDDMRDFGESVLLLGRDKNYSTYIDTGSDYLVAVVNAAAPDSLEPYLWSYPFLGDAPYRGFYDESDARAEADRLSERGYEVWIRRVDGFSTLGFTRDPLYSFMLSYSDFRLSQLIFHEQIHASYWMPAAVQFNEELATSLGQMAALEYLGQRHGENSEAYTAAVQSIHDSRLFASDLNELARQLQAYFDLARSEGYSSDELQRGRDELIRTFQQEFTANYSQRYLGENYAGFSDMEINTAFISLYQTYNGRAETYQKLYEKYGSVSEVLRHIEEAADNPENIALQFNRGDDPFVLVEALLELKP